MHAKVISHAFIAHIYWSPLLWWLQTLNPTATFFKSFQSCSGLYSHSVPHLLMWVIQFCNRMRCRQSADSGILIILELKTFHKWWTWLQLSRSVVSSLPLKCPFWRAPKNLSLLQRFWSSVLVIIFVALGQLLFHNILKKMIKVTAQI